MQARVVLLRLSKEAAWMKGGAAESRKEPPCLLGIMTISCKLSPFITTSCCHHGR